MNEPHDKVFGDLFEAVQMGHVFPDSKTFVDCIPREDPSRILQLYQQEKNKPGFDLGDFVTLHFDLPVSPSTDFVADVSRPIEDHIVLLWDVLKRDADRRVPGSSLIPLPHPYIVPGGRFGEIYYWDSYFTMLGLEASGRIDMVRHMVDNFSYLIKTIGFIPNGNRTYFLGRSQPPFYALMVKLLAASEGPELLQKYLPFLEREYNFWMDGRDQVHANDPAQLRVVWIEEDVVLNRYWDTRPAPREESYLEDVELAEKSEREPASLYRDLRAGCESGWDFSSRWFRDGKSLAQIRTTGIVPVDLNCLLFYLEKTLSETHRLAGNDFESVLFHKRSQTRRDALMELCWDEKLGYFMDYDFRKGQRTGIASAASLFPLFFGMADPEQAFRTANFTELSLVRPGGLVTSPYRSGQQWDAPNGWAPLQWIAIEGLRNYGIDLLAEQIKARWIDLNNRVYKNTGKMMEKYNVEDISLFAGGGEYPVQDGFGWSNGVLLKLLKE